MQLFHGDNGILKNAARARIQQSHSSVAEAISLQYNEYVIQLYTSDAGNTEEGAKVASTQTVQIQGEENKVLAETETTFLDFLLNKGYINEQGVVNVEKLIGQKTLYGNGEDGETDVYKIEEEENLYILRYYEDAETKEFLWQIDKNSSSSTSEINWNEIFQNAKPAQGQDETNTAIGLGSKGEPVNMDYWMSEKNSEGNGYILRGRNAGSGGYLNAYTEEFDESGKIKGVMPQYIKKDGDDTFLPVLSLEYTFADCTGLKVAPEIPSSVTDMSSTFYYCTNLETAPEIPSSVTNMYDTFFGCSSLKTAPEIPSSVTNMYGTFLGCSSLKTAPEIPSSVTDMGSTFSGCSSLETVPEIPSSVINMSFTFSSCTSLETAPEIPSSVTDMGGTFSGCSSLETAPEIPSSVTDMVETFSRCSSLKTAPEIPSGVTNMRRTFYGCSKLKGKISIKTDDASCEYCFEGAATSGETLTLVGSNKEFLEELQATGSSDSKIEIEVVSNEEGTL